MPPAEQLPLLAFAQPGTAPRELLPRDGSALFVPEFLAAAQAEQHFRRLHEALHWEQRSLRIAQREIPQPRLAAWIADAGVHYSYSGLSLRRQDWTHELLALRALVEARAGQRFNGLLANLYRDGRDSVAWHADDEAELGPEPVIASLSLGATRRFELRHEENRETVRVDLSAGSLVVMSGLSQARWRHRVPKQPRIDAARINLTFRAILPPRAAQAGGA